jgi:hypothetical protein
MDKFYSRILIGDQNHKEDGGIRRLINTFKLMEHVNRCM